MALLGDLEYARMYTDERSMSEPSALEVSDNAVPGSFTSEIQ